MVENGEIKIKIVNLSKFNLKVGRCLLKYTFAPNFIVRWFWLGSSYYWKLRMKLSKFKTRNGPEYFG